MTSTGTFKGFQDGSRNSSKVLKPPGGGSSDIFGSAETVDSPRRVKQNHNQSQLGSNFFGDHQQQNHHQPQQKEISSNGSSAPETPRSKPDGNPVTGAGYDSHANNSTAQQNGNGVGGDTPSIGSDKSSTDSSPSAGGVTRMKNRVPPGGYSSGLW